MDADVSILKGKTLSKCWQEGGDELHFETTEGKHYKLYHRQDCCESVSIEDVVGDLADLVGAPLGMAEEASNEPDPGPKTEGGYTDESGTWTFYKFATEKGYVTVRWYGSSNGYYSESVDFDEVP